MLVKTAANPLTMLGSCQREERLGVECSSEASKYTPLLICDMLTGTSDDLVNVYASMFVCVCSNMICNDAPCSLPTWYQCTGDHGLGFTTKVLVKLPGNTLGCRGQRNRVLNMPCRERQKVIHRTVCSRMISLMVTNWAREAGALGPAML